MNVDNTRLLAEHARGDSYRQIGKRYGVSHEHARRIVSERGSELIRDLERDLLEAQRLERQGLEAEWPTYLLPFQAQQDWQDALAMFDWTVKKLRGRGFQIDRDRDLHDARGHGFHADGSAAARALKHRQEEKKNR